MEGKKLGWLLQEEMDSAREILLPSSATSLPSFFS